MLKLKEKLEVKLNVLNETYDYYLAKVDDPVNSRCIRAYEDKLHDLRVEMNTIKLILEELNEEMDKS